jgi:hypothetical protein
VLNIIGYSLRDEHINEMIAIWFNADKNHKIRIIDPEPRNLEQGFGNHLLRGHARDRVQIIQEKAVNGISELIKAK